MAEMLEDIANSIHGWSAGSKKRMGDALDELSFYDYHQVCTSLMLLKVEIGLGGANSREPDEWKTNSPKKPTSERSRVRNIARFLGYI